MAFQGAGRAPGDLIKVSYLDEDAGNDPASFVFGSTGKGGLSLIDRGSNTLVRGNVDDDPAFKFRLLIEDGGVTASAYTADDFILTFA
jgi:hypothetical protein